MKRYNLIPLLLVAYLGIMSYIGFRDYKAGIYSPLYYFGIIAITLLCIGTLRFFLKKRYDQRKDKNNNNR